MSKLNLTKDGIFFVYFDMESREVISDEVDSFVPYLNCPISIQNGYTIGDFFKLLNTDADFVNEVYQIDMGDYEVQDLLNEMNGHYQLEEDVNIPGIKQVLFGESGIVTQSTNPDFDANLEFFGYPEYLYDDVEGGYYIPVEYVPVSHLKDTKLVLTNKFVIDRENIDIIGPDFSDTELQRVFEGSKEVSLNELIHVLLINFCLAGDPVSKLNGRKRMSNNIQEQRINDKIVDDLLNGENNEKE